MSLTFESPIDSIKNVGPKRKKIFEASGIYTVEDLLFYLPYKYEDWRFFKKISELKIGELQCIKGQITKIYHESSRNKKFTWIMINVADETGEVELHFANQLYLLNIFMIKDTILVRGVPQCNAYNNKIIFNNPDYYIEKDAKKSPQGSIIPVYRKIKSISSKIIMEIIHEAFSNLDTETNKKAFDYSMLKYSEKIRCLKSVHFPSEADDLQALEKMRTDSHIKLISEEFYQMQLGLAFLNLSKKIKEMGIAFKVDDEIRNFARSILPFKLTTGQKRALFEIVEDMKKPFPMNRLLQGDVGSGKTIVCLMAMLICIHNGYQAALMAPTEILAEQHYINITNLLKNSDIKVDLLIGNLNKAVKDKVLFNIANGFTNIIVGTHAIIQENVQFNKLGLVVIDEQHRFGVNHRALLQKKGMNPDVLVSTATPIPRSLALTLYGDLDISIIDVLPTGRKPIKTIIKRDSSRSQVYKWLADELSRGKQAYVVCPLIEESESIQAKAAVELYEFLQKNYLKNFKLGLLHGNISKEEREVTMKKFLNKELNALIATTVIEVGIDVPNASIMVIEHAERFGLAQLHQLRGRVGRSSDQSYCILIAPSKLSNNAIQRLSIIRNNNNGFVIAEKDMEIRGVGELAGLRQSGFFNLRIANIERDKDILIEARKEASKFIEKLFENKQELEYFELNFMPKWYDRYKFMAIS